ncbi:MAG TPA: hypothetical protein VH082_14485 [Rudaea sp.]|jgi:hypothetical protein|nr:hypothetical protein [Rudaea sp.]
MLAEAHRRELLSAMGVDVFVLRAASAATVHADANADWLVVAASAETQKSTQCAQLRKTLPTMLGIPSERVRWMAGETNDIPDAAAYLVLGAALAREFGANLPAVRQQSAVIAVADEPAASFTGAMAKRALWQSLKPIARRAREVGAW